MFWNGQEVMDWIQSQLKFGIRPGLERMELALARLKNPHHALQMIHIAGTNGKGSTVTYLRSVLEVAGYQVGTFTSPYIETFNERICLNQTPISDDDLAWCANVVKPIVEEINATELGPMTEFEIITLISFVYFKQVNVDVVIYEVGLGGRLDSTNVINPLICGITNIGHDHQGILGETLSEIAMEKLGIVKPHVPLLTTIEQPELLTLCEKVCHANQAPLLQPLKQYPVKQMKFTTDGMSFDWPKLANVKLRMHGQHQIKNATLAYGILNYLREKKNFKISDVCIYRGLKEAFWKGRFEVILDEGPIVILDGAHNEEGIERLCETLQQKYPNKSYHIVMSALADKQATTLVTPLAAIATKLYLTTFDFYRAQPAHVLKSRSGVESAHVCECFETLLDELFETLTKDDCLVITGSLYFIASVRNYLMP